MKRIKLIPILTILAGFLLVIFGLILIGFYIYSAIQSLDQADQSLLFWYIPLIFIGILLNVSGAFFIAVGMKARQNPALQKLSRNLLFVLGGSLILVLAFIWTGERRADQTREEIKQQQQIRSDLHKIDHVQVNNLTVDGFTLNIESTGTVHGDYKIEIIFSDIRDRLYHFNEAITLKSDESDTEFEFSIDDIFRDCTIGSNQSYFCVDNAGTTNSELKISTRLIPFHVEGLDLPITGVETSWTTSLYLDTFTRNGIVEVEKIIRE
jgi:hypothetical protein